MTLAEVRQYRLFLAILSPRKTPLMATRAISDLFGIWKDWIHKITYENDRESNVRATIAKALN